MRIGWRIPQGECHLQTLINKEVILAARFFQPPILFYSSFASLSLQVIPQTKRKKGKKIYLLQTSKELHPSMDWQWERASTNLLQNCDLPPPLKLFSPLDKEEKKTITK